MKSGFQLAKIQISVNIEASKEIVYIKGLRQGDLLSPLLFVLIVDGFNMMIRKANGAR